MNNLNQYSAYAAKLRHELHQCPEIGFELTETLSIVRRELTENGIPFTESFGRGSIVATIGEEKSNFTIGVRGDMDALPMQEASKNPYPSRNPGAMHACGHDIHTANLLSLGKYLQEHREWLRCRIKLLFTPAEEYIEPGCRILAENGVMDDIDCAIALHVTPDYPIGTVGVSEISPGSNSMGFTVEFFGKSAHVCSQQSGVDAIYMAVKAYSAMEMMLAKELPLMEPALLNIGVINGGKAGNIISNYCSMVGSCRAWTDEMIELMKHKLRNICESVAQECGGTTKFTVNKLLPYVLQNPVMVKKIRAAAAKVLGEEHVLVRKRKLGGEDFGFLSRKKPCAMFQLGISNGSPETSNPLHTTAFDADEKCFEPALATMLQFISDNMDGILFEENER